MEPNHNFKSERTLKNIDLQESNYCIQVICTLFMHALHIFIYVHMTKAFEKITT